MQLLRFSWEQNAYVCPTNTNLSVVLRPIKKGRFKGCYKVVVNDADATFIGILQWFATEWALNGDKGVWMSNPDNRVMFQAILEQLNSNVKALRRTIYRWYCNHCNRKLKAHQRRIYGIGPCCKRNRDKEVRMELQALNDKLSSQRREDARWSYIAELLMQSLAMEDSSVTTGNTQ